MQPGVDGLVDRLGDLHPVDVLEGADDARLDALAAFRSPWPRLAARTDWGSSPALPFPWCRQGYRSATCGRERTRPGAGPTRVHLRGDEVAVGPRSLRRGGGSHGRLQRSAQEAAQPGLDRLGDRPLPATRSAVSPFVPGETVAAAVVALSRWSRPPACRPRSPTCPIPQALASCLLVHMQTIEALDSANLADGRGPHGRPGCAGPVPWARRGLGHRRSRRSCVRRPRRSG